MGRTKRRHLGFALVALALLLTAAPAQASFKKLGTISDPSASEHDVAMDPGGRAFFVWTQEDTSDPPACLSVTPCYVAKARVRGPSGTLGPVETISDPSFLSTPDPEVAVDERGNAVFVWIGETALFEVTVFARTRSAAGVLGPIENVSNVPPAGFLPSRPHVAVDEHGGAVFVWEEFDLTGPCGSFGCLRPRARRRSAAGVYGPKQDLSAAGKNAFFPQVGVDEYGNAVFVWRLEDGTPSCLACSLIQARALAATGVLSPTQTLSAPGFPGPGQVAVNESGNAVFTWERADGTTQCGGGECFRIQTRTRSRSGSLSSTQTISDSRQDAIAPQVGIAGSGKAVYVWSRGDGSTACSGGAACFVAQTRTRSWSGSLGSIRTISESRRNAFVPQVAVDSRGNAVFAWERIDEAFDCGFGTCSQVQARSVSYSGTLSRIQTLSDLGGAADPMVAVDPNGGRQSATADAASDWLGPTTQIEAAVQRGYDD